MYIFMSDYKMSIGTLKVVSDFRHRIDQGDDGRRHRILGPH